MIRKLPPKRVVADEDYARFLANLYLSAKDRPPDEQAALLDSVFHGIAQALENERATLARLVAGRLPAGDARSLAALLELRRIDEVDLGACIADD